MGIFYKRPLCLFCFCFIGTALLAAVVGFVGKIIVCAISIILTALLFVLSARIEKRKYGLIEAAICMVFVALALISSILAIDLTQKRLEKYTGENAPIEFVVLETKYSSRYATKYEGILLSTDKGKIGATAYLDFDHEADYLPGDKLLLVGNVTVRKSADKKLLPSDVYLEIESTLDKDLIILKEFDGFSLSVTAAKLRYRIRNIFCERLEGVAADLSFGILTSDTSLLSGQIIRDFRRSGISHLLAVSGLHLSLLAGLFDFLLIKLKVRKGIRCIATTMVSLVLLTVAGFSLSAVRSVLMLLVAYLCYFLSREPDTLTSLSISGALILLISPCSVGSLSFWLSFLATLGIVLYSEALSKMRQEKRKNKSAASRLVLRVLRKISGALTVTLTANVFICIVFYLVFGEVSVISPIANLTVTPLGEVYLVLSVATLLFGNFPLIGTLLCRTSQVLAALITSLAATLSSLDFSVLSLRYPFSGLIIITATLVLAVLFTVKLKNKVWLFAAPTLALLCFCVCLVLYNTVNTNVNAAYISNSGRDSIAVADKGKLIIIDVSDGSYSALSNSYEWARDNAFAEADTVVLTHYHERHIPSLRKFFSNVIVNNVYLPEPKTKEDILILRSILSLAKENGVSAKIYEEGALLKLGESQFFMPREMKSEVSSRKIVSFALRTRDGLLYYTDALSQVSDTAELGDVFIKSSDVLIVGSHSPLPEEYRLNIPSIPPRVIIADSVAYLCEFGFENNR